MSLTIQEKLALMMTSAGSQRNLAAVIGVTHQRVGRWLRGPAVNMHTGEISNEPTDPAIIAAVNQAFSIHRDIARQQARHDKIPFDPALPIYVERKPFADGTPGERAVAEHTQWIGNDLREKVFISVGKSGGYLNVSVRSVVDLRRYNKAANDRGNQERARGEVRTREQNRWRGEIREALDDGIIQKPIYTKAESFYAVRMTRGEVSTVRPVHGEVVAGEVANKLAQKHEPATGEAGTKLADQYLFQTIPQWITEAPTPKKRHAKKTARSNRKAHPKARAKAKKR